jgi:hypothetical protein
MGEYVLQNESFDSLPTRPEVLSGHVLLGRSVLKMVKPEEFEGNRVLMNLSNQDLYSNVRGVKKIVRRQTQLEDIIRTVLNITHNNMSQGEELDLDELLENLLEEYKQSIDLTDKNISEAIDDKIPKIANTDLMKGMDAFAEAEYNQHQGSYEHTLILPARRLAGWMILRETEIEHV